MPRPNPTLFLTAIVAGLTAASANAKTVVFDFEDQEYGAVTPLTSTVDGLTATFASATDAEGFQITSAFYQTLTGNYLAGPGPDFVTGNTLTISFSQAVRSITLNFAVDTAPTLTLSTSARGGATATGIAPGGSFLYPEGVLSFAGPRFNSVTLSSDALSFAIDNINVTVPEPSAFALFGMGLVAAAALRRRATA